MPVKYQGSLTGVDPSFLTKFTGAVAAIGGTKVKVISGYRTPGRPFTNLYGQTVTESYSPHNQGIALDAEIYIPGRGWVPAGTALKNIAPSYGLRSGDQPGFYLGRPDPNHVDMVTNSGAGVKVGAKTPPSGRLSFQQIEGIWIQAGGQKSLAPTMAAIALAESDGDPNAHNYSDVTKDDSWGLWQINYYGNLRDTRTKNFGPPQSMTNPTNNARAAVTLAHGGKGLNNWSTYRTSVYKSYFPGGDHTGGVASPGHRGYGGNFQQPDPGGGLVGGIGGFFGGIFSGVQKDIVAIAIILGGGMLIVVGLGMVGLDLGISAFNQMGGKKTTPLGVAKTTVAKRQARKFDKRKAASRASTGGPAKRETGDPQYRFRKSPEKKVKKEKYVSTAQTDEVPF